LLVDNEPVANCDPELCALAGQFHGHVSIAGGNIDTTAVHGDHTTNFVSLVIGFGKLRRKMRSPPQAVKFRVYHDRISIILARCIHMRSVMNVVLVTGASSGIGAATAIAFAEAGWSVMAAGRDEGRLDEVADVSDNISTWAGELIEAEDCEELIAETIDEFGNIDCLVNSAGVLMRGNAEETSDDDWRDTLTVNLDVAFYLSRAALPHLLQAEGSIVNVSSFWGLKAGERAVAYCASKGGLIMMTRAMALDHAADGLRINAVCPGGVDTPMLAAGADDTDKDVDAFLADVADHSPNGRIASPEDIAGLIMFLASDAARHITGTAIPIDGGLMA
jgi:NAD(P)-dependent dehydrogenase (short-subunit alcohol dehydrogenase family)